MNPRKTVKVWDPLVRIFHWSLVTAFAVAWLTAEDDFADLHTTAGYLIMGLVAFRLVWGVIGTRHARFTSFVRSPGAALAYLKDLALFRGKAYVGHNPAAAWMVIALLVSLTLTGVSGMMLYGADEGQGPMAAVMAPYHDLEDPLEEAHEVLAGFTLFLVGLHLAGILASSFVHRENLIRAMVTGRKEVHMDTDDDETGAAGAWKGRAAAGVVLLLVLAAAGQGLAGQSMVPDRLDAYRAQGAGPFTVEAGRTLWNGTYTVEGKKTQCADCHTADMTKPGKHKKTGKPIDPIAPSVQPDRLTDVKKIEKWLLRNCKETLGRECTPQEKGDVLMFIQAQ